VLVDRGLLRDVAFIGSGDVRVYASLYGPASSRASEGVVICNSWGAEVALAVDASHRLASTLADGGIASVLHHPAGHLDSGGDPREVTLQDLVDAAVASTALLRERFHVERVSLVGFGLGAAVAALAAGKVDARAVILLEPALDPAAFFAEQQRGGARGALGRGTRAAPFGHALPDAIPGEEVTGQVRQALAGRSAVAFRFVASARTPLPTGVREVVVPGSRAGRRWPQRLVEPAAAALLERAA
jgi:alpha-beta hydrolase superfamily lysophospholipase